MSGLPRVRTRLCTWPRLTGLLLSLDMSGHLLDFIRTSISSLRPSHFLSQRRDSSVHTRYHRQVERLGLKLDSQTFQGECTHSFHAHSSLSISLSSHALPNASQVRYRFDVCTCLAAFPRSIPRPTSQKSTSLSRAVVQSCSGLSARPDRVDCVRWILPPPPSWALLRKTSTCTLGT